MPNSLYFLLTIFFFRIFCIVSSTIFIVSILGLNKYWQIEIVNPIFSLDNFLLFDQLFSNILAYQVIFSVSEILWFNLLAIFWTWSKFSMLLLLVAKILYLLVVNHVLQKLKKSLILLVKRLNPFCSGVLQWALKFLIHC